MAGSIYNRRIENFALALSDDKVWQLVDEQGVVAACQKTTLT